MELGLDGKRALVTGSSAVVTIGSRATTSPLANMVEYSAAKAAVVNMTVSLAQHLAGTGVTANCVSPGVILTPSLQQLFMDRAGARTDRAELEPAMTADYAPNPVGRLGRPEDVAAAVAFLAGQQADYIIGVNLRADRRYHRHRLTHASAGVRHPRQVLVQQPVSPVRRAWSPPVWRGRTHRLTRPKRPARQARFVSYPCSKIGRMSEALVGTADDLASWAASAPAGEGVLTPFGFLDRDRLTDAGRIDALVALERLKSWADSEQARLLADLEVSAERAGDDKRFVHDEVGGALRLSPIAVAERVCAARELVDRFPATLELLQEGAITTQHVRALVRHVLPLTGDVAARVDKAVVEKAGSQTPAAFGRAVRKAVLAVDPRDAETRHQDAVVDRRVCATPGPNGMGELWAALPADGLATLMTALTAMAAAKIPGDERTTDQRRADALISLAAQQLNDPGIPKWQGRRPTVQVTVSAETLLHLDDEPGELDGYGPVPAAMARAIAADPSGTWRRLLTDEAGVLVDGSQTYRPAADLDHFVRARDRTCRFPHCPRPARRTELDHQIPWEDGGPTTPENLECLCSRHHHLKHETGWRVSGDPAGELTWISPTGHVYRSPPSTYE